MYPSRIPFRLYLRSYRRSRSFCKKIILQCVLKTRAISFKYQVLDGYIVKVLAFCLAERSISGLNAYSIFF